MPRDYGRGRGALPTVDLSWFDTQEYVKWLSERTHKKYRLLSEAEWEYVSRAGTQTLYPWGSKASHEYANYGTDICYQGLASAREKGAEASAPAGQFPPNGFGLNDMQGNVWEWVADCWNPTYEGAPTNGDAWTTGDCSQRVFRGGAWDSDPAHLRSAARSSRNPANKSSDAGGFRVARTQ